MYMRPGTPCAAASRCSTTPSHFLSRSWLKVEWSLLSSYPESGKAKHGSAIPCPADSRIDPSHLSYRSSLKVQWSLLNSKSAWRNGRQLQPHYSKRSESGKYECRHRTQGTGAPLHPPTSALGLRWKFFSCTGVRLNSKLVWRQSQPHNSNHSESGKYECWHRTPCAAQIRFSTIPFLSRFSLKETGTVTAAKFIPLRIQVEHEKEDPALFMPLRFQVNPEFI